MPIPLMVHDHFMFTVCLQAVDYRCPQCLRGDWFRTEAAEWLPAPSAGEEQTTHVVLAAVLADGAIHGSSDAAGCSENRPQRVR